MSIIAEELLDTMTVRYEMQRDGITNPSQEIKDLTKRLVYKLSRVEKNSKVILKFPEKGNTEYYQYILKSTGEILAEINLKMASVGKT